jgi:hypothetical protein
VNEQRKAVEAALAFLCALLREADNRLTCRAEAAEERRVERFYGDASPCTELERYQRARQL